MIFKIPEIISHWSTLTMEPGDIIATGTPAGVSGHRPVSGRSPRVAQPVRAIETSSTETAGAVMRDEVLDRPVSASPN